MSVQQYIRHCISLVYIFSQFLYELHAEVSRCSRALRHINRATSWRMYYYWYSPTKQSHVQLISTVIVRGRSLHQGVFSRSPTRVLSTNLLITATYEYRQTQRRAKLRPRVKNRRQRCAMFYLFILEWKANYPKSSSYRCR